MTRVRSPRDESRISRDGSTGRGEPTLLSPQERERVEAEHALERADDDGWPQPRERVRDLAAFDGTGPA